MSTELAASLAQPFALAAIACCASAVQAAFGAALVLVFVAANDWLGVLPASQAVMLASALSIVNALASVRWPLVPGELRQAVSIARVAVAALLVFAWVAHAMPPSVAGLPRLASAIVIVAIGVATAATVRVPARLGIERAAAVASGLLGAVVGVPGPPLALYLHGSRPRGDAWNAFFLALAALATTRLTLSVGQSGFAQVGWESFVAALLGVQLGARLGRHAAGLLASERRRCVAGWLIVASGASIGLAALSNG